MEAYRQRIDNLSKSGEERDQMHTTNVIERQLRLAGLRAERRKINELARARKISDESARKLVRQIDLLEARANII